MHAKRRSDISRNTPAGWVVLGAYRLWADHVFNGLHHERMNILDIVL